MATQRKPKPKPGRKFRTGEPTKLFTMRLTEEEHERYRAAAEAELLSLSEWIRATLESELERKRR